jgi:uncharacterized membrane protein
MITTAPPTTSAGWAFALSAVLAGAGVVHLVAPGVYDNVVPHALPGSRTGWTVASGVAELACAALVTRRSTRRTGATLTTVLFVAIFPANVEMAADWRRRSRVDPFIAYARLPLQVLLIAWAFHVRRDASRRPTLSIGAVKPGPTV